jgi:hypothetical protein
MTPDDAEATQFFLLRGVVERLEREIGSLDELAAERLFDQGKLHLVFALRHAREGLAAGVSDPIRVAQVLELERAGQKMQRAYRALIARNKGTANSAAKRSANARTFWTPWITCYRELQREGKSRKEALDEIEQELADRGTPRDRKAIGNWCK